MNQEIYIDAQQNNTRFVRELNIRLQWLALKNSLISFVIACVLGTWMNSWKFDIGVALAIFIVVYYVRLYKESTDASVLASILTVGIAIIGLDFLVSKFKVASTVIMLIFGLFPFVKGLVIPVVKLCIYAFRPAA